jgi:protein ImuA
LERLWATEQILQAGPVGAVLAWLPQARPEQIRRLQIHAQSCDAPVFLPS